MARDARTAMATAIRAWRVSGGLPCELPLCGKEAGWYRHTPTQVAQYGERHFCGARLPAANCHMELLCVSDKPLRGEIKLPAANGFYERAVAQHLEIHLTALDLLRERRETPHSHKLRSFDEPPFR
jgi:hypothetical protein